MQTGAIGSLRHVDVAFSFNNTDGDNIRNRPETGGGGIRDIGVYAYGSVRYATGAEPADLQARVRRENGIDTFAQVTGRMVGPIGDFTYSAMTSMRLFPRQEVVFQGDAGLIRLTAPFNAGTFGEARIELHQPGTSTRIERFPGLNQYILQVEAFGHSVRTGAAYACPLEFSRGTQEMMDRVFEVQEVIGG